MDTRLVGYLQRSLSCELSAVQQYLAQSALAARWGQTDLAQRLRADAQEELDHAHSLIEQLLQQGVAPNAAQLQTARLGRDVEEMLVIDRALELEVIRLYDEAARYCERTRQSQPRELFLKLLRDEQGHLQTIDDCLAKRRQGVLA